MTWRTLLSVDPKNLDADAELRRFFGSKVVSIMHDCLALSQWLTEDWLGGADWRKPTPTRTLGQAEVYHIQAKAAISACNVACWFGDARAAGG